MKTSVSVVRALVFLAPAFSPFDAVSFESDACVREYKLASDGGIYSSVSPFFPGSQLFCNVYVQPRSTSAHRYDIQAGGLFNVIRPDSTRVHSYQLLSPGGSATSYTHQQGQYRVSQGSVEWQFSGKDLSLEKLVHSPTGKSCLVNSKINDAKAQVQELISGQYINLAACDDIVTIDLGDSDTRQSAALKRDRLATVKGVVKGNLYECKVEIGRLYDYQVPVVEEIPVSENVVIDPFADPCLRPALQAYPGLPAARAIEQFVRSSQGHACVSATKRNYSAPPAVLAARYAAKKPYRKVSDGTDALQAGDVIYQIKPLAEVRQAIEHGSGEGCRVLAPKVHPLGGGSSGAPGSGAVQ